MQHNHQKICCPNCGTEIETRSGDDTRMTTREMVETVMRFFGPNRERASSSSSKGSFDSMGFPGMVIEAIVQKFPQLQTRAQLEDPVSEWIWPILDRLQTMEQRISGAETIATTSVRTLKLVFFDQVVDPVLTSKKIRSKEDKLIRVALIDEKTGDTVNLGPESFLRAEIVLLDASDGSDENNWTRRDFLSRIIKEGDKTMPHFSKAQYVDLNKGVADLDDLKLGHDKSWTKNSKCKLGVRLAGNNNLRGGVEVREGWTNSFMVCDSRGKLYKKGNPPCLSDRLWKLVNIGRNGGRIKRLRENKVETVKDFLFLHSVDPTRLQRIILGEQRNAEDSESWKAIVKHAKTSITDDTKIYVYVRRSPESERSVVFDLIEGLKGLIDKGRYVCVGDLSEDDKRVARELLKSAFENQNDIMPFSDEASLLAEFPLPSNEDFGVARGSLISAFGNQNDRIPFSDEASLMEIFPLPSSKDFGVAHESLISASGNQNYSDRASLMEMLPLPSSKDFGVAHESLISAFGNQNDSDEASLMEMFPLPSNEDFGVAHESLMSAFGNQNDSDQASLMEMDFGTAAAAIPVLESLPSTSRLGYGGFSTDEQDGMSQAMIIPDFSHDSEQYGVTSFISSPGFYEQDPYQGLVAPRPFCSSLSRIPPAGIRGQPLTGLSDRALHKWLMGPQNILVAFRQLTIDLYVIEAAIQMEVLPN